MAYERYYSIGFIARMLECTTDDVMQLINQGVLEADAATSGEVIVIKEASIEMERAKQALKDQQGVSR
ncbi:MAG: hypothetical protein MSG64_06420 [Pyrinomonadaceae bacterium MAG19_C2-C3]|nr:hypothetical protein [Pyrinomonadaceae bacterium MAG19_C2-C3]